jgi:N6-L-threonylcarbamoyladenine synthase
LGKKDAIDFPRPLLPGSYDFSFSGLKSSVINYIHGLEQNCKEVPKADVAASFQAAIIDVLVKKSQLALRETGLKNIVLAGGVSANKALQEALDVGAAEVGAKLVHPTPILCTDNAVMIATRGYYMYKNNEFSDYTLNANPSLKLGSK